MLAGLVGLSACGRGPGAPSPMVRTTVRVVSALNPQVGLPQVAVRVGSGPEQQTDASGMAVLEVETAATVSIRLTHPAYVDRETSVRVPDDRTVDLSLIPLSHNMAAFEELSPRTAGLQRWTRNPKLLVLTHAVDYSAATLGFREFPVINRRISPGQLDCLSAGIAAALPDMGGGHLTWESIEIGEVEPGTRFRTDQTEDGTIVVLPATSLGAVGRGTAYVGAEPFTLTRGAVWMTTDLIDFCLISLLYRHELGHALGYLHVTRTVSMMSEGLPATLTEFDRSSISILFQRRPGNRSPDRDPSGVPVNVAAAGLRYGSEPLR